MPNVKQPIELIALKGKKHLTKKEISERMDSEIKAPSDAVVAPDYLTKKQKEEFDTIANELIKINIMANLDCDALARYIIANGMYLKFTKMLNGADFENIVVAEKIVGMQDKYFKQCRAAANDLGLTITSRCKIVVPKKEEPPKNKFSKFQKSDSG